MSVTTGLRGCSQEGIERWRQEILRRGTGCGGEKGEASKNKCEAAKSSGRFVL